jgi:hypothetical protein
MQLGIGEVLGRGRERHRHLPPLGVVRQRLAFTRTVRADHSHPAASFRVGDRLSVRRPDRRPLGGVPFVRQSSLHPADAIQYPYVRPGASRHRGKGQSLAVRGEARIAIRVERRKQRSLLPCQIAPHQRRLIRGGQQRSRLIEQGRTGCGKVPGPDPGARPQGLDHSPLRPRDGQAIDVEGDAEEGGLAHEQQPSRLGIHRVIGAVKDDGLGS